jgi:CRP-like cAMP-binding protein
VATLFKEEVIPKGTFLVKKGGYSKKMVFLKSGYIRCYFQTEKKAVTHWVFWKGQILCDTSSFILKTPSKWNFQALTDCQAYSIGFEDYQNIEKVLPDWAKYEKNLLIKLITALENRVYALISMSSEDRYHFLFKTHPELFNQIPLTYIASILNMTPETLSRIRRKSIS